MQLVSIGYPQLLLQNVIYALPSFHHQISCFPTSTVQFSNDPTFATFLSVSLDPSSVGNSFAFLRCTGGNITVKIAHFMTS